MIVIFLSSAIKVVTEYERSVFFRLGHVRPEAKGPGVIFRFPIVDRLVKVTLRVEVVDIPPQAVITKDNVTIQVDAVVYFQVVDPVQAVLGVDNFRFASQRIAMTSLRSIIGRHELDNLLAHREDVNNELRTVIAASTQHWGVEVRQVELRDITLPPELLRAMARQAEAERERRAKVIAATGELEASQELSEAAAKLYESPGALQLRALQTLAEVASEHNSTLVFPVPIELLTGFITHGRDRRATRCRRSPSSLLPHRGRRPRRCACRPLRTGWPPDGGSGGSGVHRDHRPRTCGVRSRRRRRSAARIPSSAVRTLAAMSSRNFS